MPVSLYFFCDSACAGCLSAIDSACPTLRTPWTQLYVYHVYVHIYDCTSIYGRRTCISTYGSYVSCSTHASIDRSIITGAISLLQPPSITLLILYRLPWCHRLPPNSYGIASSWVSENVSESTEAKEKATETKRHVANYILSEEELSKVTIQCVNFSNSNST